MKETVGGGPKKVLYTLNTLRRIGVRQSSKALNAKNACKACGLGMGGQLGGMTNERGEFPSVCNKSVQAQSTDIQAPIPKEIFQHSIDELKELSAHELEHLGRLNTPLYKAKGATHFTAVDWNWAINYAAEQLLATKPERSFFYASGRSSNEAGFLLQLMARVYGTNNITNCSYYCHQATGVGLSNSIGTGTATISLDDLQGCDLVFVIGANPASNHPRLIHQLKNCRERGGHVVVINPAKEPGLVKFAVPKSARSMIAGGTDIASYYLQPNIGSDIAVLKGIAKAILEMGAEDSRFIDKHCDNFGAFKADIQHCSWQQIESASGLKKVDIEQAALIYANSKYVVFAWGMGVTHHRFGTENVEYISNIALLRGMIGKTSAGLLPLRGHSNVQGIGTIGVKPELPKAMTAALESMFDIQLPQQKGLDTLASLESAAEGDIDTAFIMGGNLYSATPHSQWAEQALNNIDFKVFLTTTLNQGHLFGSSKESLILPVTARDEEHQATTQESMFNFVRLSDGGIDRLNNVHSEVDIIAGIAEILLKDSSINFKHYRNHNRLRETIAASVAGMSQLKDIADNKQEFHIQGRILHQQSFATDNMRAKFHIHAIAQETQSKDYPYLLASIRSEGQFNSIIYEHTDSYRHDAERNTVFMAKADMQARGLKSGDLITVTSATGTMPNSRVQMFDIPAGNVLAYYPEANILTSTTRDPRSKTPNFKSVAVNITPQLSEN